MESNHLKSLLETKGIKQRWVAKQLKVSDAMVSYWISGERPITKDKADELKRLFA